MSGILPENPKAKEIILKSNQPIINSMSASGKRQARRTEAHLWSMKAKYDIMDRNSIAPLFTFVASQGLNSFQVILPERKESIAGASGSVTAGTASKGSSAVSISGLIGTLKIGDIIKFSGHTKVYMITQDSTGSSINFFPDLIVSVSGGSVLINNVPFTVYMPEDVVEWKTKPPVLSTYELLMMEDV